MPKRVPPSSSGFYHLAIPLDDPGNEDVDDFTTMIKPITEKEAKQLSRLFRKISRNQPCPCGSGDKFKRCCLRRAN